MACAASCLSLQEVLRTFRLSMAVSVCGRKTLPKHSGCPGKPTHGTCRRSRSRFSAGRRGRKGIRHHADGGGFAHPCPMVSRSPYFYRRSNCPDLQAGRKCRLVSDAPEAEATGHANGTCVWKPGCGWCAPPTTRPRRQSPRTGALAVKSVDHGLTPSAIGVRVGGGGGTPKRIRPPEVRVARCGRSPKGRTSPKFRSWRRVNPGRLRPRWRVTPAAPSTKSKQLCSLRSPSTGLPSNSIPQERLRNNHVRRCRRGKVPVTRPVCAAWRCTCFTCRCVRPW